MISYSISCKQRKQELNQLFAYFFKKWLISAAIMAPFAIYFLVIGFLVDTEAFIYGVPLTALIGMIGIYAINFYQSVCKAQYQAFVKDSQNELVTFSMRLELEELICKNETADREIRIPLATIERVADYKGIYVLIFKEKKGHLLITKNEQTTHILTKK